MKVKLTYVGPIQTRPDGKTFREVGADEFNGERKSAWKTAPQLEGCKPGDEVEIELSENGKYINKVTKAGNPTQGYGGKAFANKTSGGWKPDPEKDAAIYTRYTLDTILQGYTKDIATAVKLVFDVREQVKARLDGKPTAVAAPDGSDIKIATAVAMVKQVDPNANDKVWANYIAGALKRKGGFDALMKDLNSCLSGDKTLEYTPDGVPAFIG